MPIYEYECTFCKHIDERIYSIANKPAESECTKCGSHSKSIISGGADRKEWDPYWDENMGSEPVLVESRSHREQLKKERGLTDQFHRKPGMPGQWV